MPSDKRNSKAMGLIFHCLMSLQPNWCLMVHAMACFMDLPVSSFVSHLSLLTVQGVDSLCDGFLHLTGIIRIFRDYRGPSPSVFSFA